MPPANLSGRGNNNKKCSILKWTPTWKVLLKFLWSFPPAKITTFTVNEYSLHNLTMTRKFYSKTAILMELTHSPDLFCIFLLHYLKLDTLLYTPIYALKISKCITSLFCFSNSCKSYRIQANSENCGPPLGNKFDLEVGQRSRSRSQHGTIGKVLSQRTHMPSIKALPVIVQKLWPRLKFLWQTDRQSEI